MQYDQLPILATKRLIVRPVTMDDVPDFFCLHTRPKNNAFPCIEPTSEPRRNKTHCCAPGCQLSTKKSTVGHPLI
jgi:hypothetical protein